MTAGYNAIRLFGLILMVSVGIYCTKKKASKEQVCMILVVVGIIIHGTGFQEQLLVQTEEGAYLALKLAYVGKCYVQWLLLLLILEYCKVRWNKYVMGVLFALHSLLLLMVVDSAEVKLYYKSLEIVADGGMQRLLFVPGPLFWVDMLLVVFYSIAIPAVALSSYFHSKKDEKNKMLLAYAMLGAVPMFTWPLICIWPEYMVVFLTQLFISILFWLVVYRYHIFNTIEFAKESVIDSLADALVVLDFDFRVLYYNEAAGNVMPGIKKTDAEAVRLIESFCHAVKDVWEKDNRYYEVVSSRIEDRKRLQGYIVTMSDITEHMRYTENLESLVEAKTEKLENIQHQVIASFANMIEMRDDVTGEHVNHTSRYVNILANGARSAGLYPEILTPEYIKILTKAAPLHDVGKIVVSDNILRKPGRLTEEEFEQIKKHSEMGGHIIGEVLNEVEDDEYLQVAKDMATHHHERWDGTGYPEGIKGEEIPLCARIMAIADVFDALISKRSYKEALSYEQAYEIIQASAGTHFDPKLVEVFMGLREEMEKVGKMESWQSGM